jgi:transcriptional regulator GlxA family with amidase domain
MPMLRQSVDGQVRPPKEMSMPVRRALGHLLRHYAAPVTVGDLAALSGRSCFQLIRAFRTELGITPHAMLIRIRVARATTMLEAGEPIAGVAVDVGFVDQTHFTRHFKRLHGDTPGRFLRARRSPPPRPAYRAVVPPSIATVTPVM